MKVWNENEIEDQLKQAAEQEEIPGKLEPQQIQQILKEKEITGKGKQKKYRKYGKWYGSLAAAACLALLLFAADHMKYNPEPAQIQKTADKKEMSEKHTDQEEVLEEPYQELYGYLKERKAEKEKEFLGAETEIKGEMTEEAVEEDSSQSGQNNSSSDSKKSTDYGQTNRQEAGVDEADMIKNDGRYLYQVVTEQDHTNAVQIADTKGGLRETARIRGFENIESMYIWKELLIILEEGYAELPQKSESTQSMGYEDAALGCGGSAMSPYTKISIYNISDRSRPKEEHTFTVQGDYLDSRISDGYFYCFLKRGINVPEDPQDYDAYIPVLEGRKIEESHIYLPKDAQALSYVLMASIDLEHPNEFKDTKAMVSNGDRVYVTEHNIYIMDSWWPKVVEAGEYSNRTKIFRFSYQDGVIKKEAEGSVKGILLDDMAVSESNGYLRLAVTAESFKAREIWDDILHQILGYDTSNPVKDNNLYVLDQKLKVVGKIEHLAENEQIYSARFMGDTGYFVTFEKTDPLFSVDVSDPKNPVILGELKISGFSEYLHFYSKDLLLGIGMEAEEDTGRTQGMKLSMFDISNPSDVKEQDKYALSEYDYSEGLYNYKAVLIDTEKNLFGFSAQGYQEDTEKKDYLLFSYDRKTGSFQEKMKIPYEDDRNGTHVNVRGTYIGEVFYLMYEDGRIESYSIENGEQREIMEGK